MCMYLYLYWKAACVTIDNSSKVCFSSIYSSDHFGRYIVSLLKLCSNYPGWFFARALPWLWNQPETSYGIIPHHPSSSFSWLMHPIFITFLYYNRWTLPKGFRKSILFLRKKNNKKKRLFSPGLRLGTLTQSHRWNLRTLLSDPGTPWIESCNLPHQAARPVHSNLAAGFFPMWIMVQRVKKHGVLFFFCRTCFGVKVSFPKQENGNLMMHLVTLMEWWM